MIPPPLVRQTVSAPSWFPLLRGLCCALASLVLLPDAAADLIGTPTPAWTQVSQGPGSPVGADERECKHLQDTQGNLFVFGNSDLDIFAIKYDSAGTLLWLQRFNGPANGEDRAVDAALDPLGNIVIIGTSSIPPAPYTHLRVVKFASVDGALLWSHSDTDLPAQSSQPTDVAIDAHGNVVVSGSTSYWNGTTAFVQKLSGGNGSLLWQKHGYVSPQLYSASADSVVLDAVGNVIVTCTTENRKHILKCASLEGSLIWEHRLTTSVFNHRNLAIDAAGHIFSIGLKTVNNSYDWHVVKHNGSTGSVLWEATYGGTGNQWDEPTSLTIDREGNPVVAGTCYSGPTSTLTNRDAWIVKFDAMTGAEIWDHRLLLNIDSPEDVSSVTTDDDNNVFVAGYVYVGSLYHYLIAKLAASDGASIWQKSGIGPQSISSTRLYAVSLDTLGHPIFSGITWNFPLASDSWLLKTSGSDGSILWTQRYSGATKGTEGWTDAVMDGTGHLIVSGNHAIEEGYSTAYIAKYTKEEGTRLWIAHLKEEGRATFIRDIKVDADQCILAVGQCFNVDSYDAMAAKFAPDGTLLWKKFFPFSPGTKSYGSAIALDASNNPTVVGYVTEAGNDDIWAKKLSNEDGQELWQFRYDGPAHGNDRPVALALDSSGDVLLTGNSGNGSHDDFYTAKYEAESGELIWEQRLAGLPSYSPNRPVAIAMTSDNGIIVTGSMADSGLTIKYSGANGSEIWRTPLYRPATVLALDPSGNLILVGKDLAAKLSPNGTVLWDEYIYLPSPTDIAIDASGNFVVKGTDHTSAFSGNDGSVLWNHPPDPGEDHSGSWNVLQSSGSLYLVGRSADIFAQYRLLISRIDVLDPEISVTLPDGSPATTSAENALGKVGVGVTTSFPVTIHNTGPGALTGLKITRGLGSSSFSYLTEHFPTSIPAYSTATLIVQCTPYYYFRHFGTITIHSSDADEPLLTFTFNVTAVDPAEITLEQPAQEPLIDGQSTRHFGSEVANSSESSRTFTVRNIGAAPLTGIVASIVGDHAGDFTINTPAPAETLNEGASDTLTITFKPIGYGARTAILRVVSNDADESPFEVTLTGEGIPTSEGPVELKQSPFGRTVALGSTVTLDAYFDGATPLIYAWRRDGHAFSAANASGTKASSLTLANITLAQAGSYSCLAGNTFAKQKRSALSAAAPIVVVDTAPKTLTGLKGRPLRLTAASGPGASYEWFHNGSPLTATTNLLLLASPKVTDSGAYVCRVTGPDAVTLDASFAVTVYDSPPVIDWTVGQAIAEGRVRAPYEFTIPLTEASPPATSFQASGLPPGLTINTKTGAIAGIPTVARPGGAPYQVNLIAINSAGRHTLKVPLVIRSLPAHVLASFSGIVPRHVPAAGAIGGRITLSTTPSGAFSGKLILGTAALPFRSFWSLNPSTSVATASVSLPRRNLPAHQLTLQVTPSSSSFQLIDISCSGVLRQQISKEQMAASTFAGNHTFILPVPTPSLEDEAYPQGTGWAAFSVHSSTGIATGAGKLSDGTAFTWSGGIGHQGHIEFFQPLYTARGSVIAAFRVISDAPASGNTVAGSVNWYRPPTTSAAGRTYGAGIGPSELAVTGASCAASVMPLGLSAGTPADLTFDLNFVDWYLPFPDIRVSADTKGRVQLPTSSANRRKTTLAINAAKGTLTGTFSLADPGLTPPYKFVTRPGAFSGVTLRDPASGQQTGHGFYLVADRPTTGQPPSATRIYSGNVTLKAAP